jgi:hypothetical protein
VEFAGAGNEGLIKSSLVKPGLVWRTTVAATRSRTRYLSLKTVHQT